MTLQVKIREGVIRVGFTGRTAHAMREVCKQNGDEVSPWDHGRGGRLRFTFKTVTDDGYHIYEYGSEGELTTSQEDGGRCHFLEVDQVDGFVDGDYIIPYADWSAQRDRKPILSFNLSMLNAVRICEDKDDPDRPVNPDLVKHVAYDTNHSKPTIERIIKSARAWQRGRAA